MPYDIGPKIGIDGEAEYRKQINNLIVQTKTLGTEMKVVTSEFKDNANSQEALTKKNEVLNKQIETQSKKLDLLKGMLEKSTKLYGEADTKTLKWKQTVNQAQSELNNLQSELSGNTKKLEEMKSKLEDTSDSSEEYQKKIDNLITKTKTLETEMKVVTSEFRDNANSQEALTKKNEVLNKQIETQSEKLDILKGMLEKSVKLYGEADTKTLKWEQAVNQAQAELNNMKSELSGNTKKLEEMESELEDTSDSLKETKESAEKAADGFTVMKGALADLAADGMETIISGAKDMVSSYDDAATKMQGQTGATIEEMEKYKDVMEEVYAGGYGEDLEEVAEAMSEVKKQTKEMDPSSLKDMTRYAMDLQQTFDFDVAESIRTVNQLTKQFGITNEEAFDIIVSGAQNGLNQNDNLLDTLNEYSPKFKAIGMSANDMYNMLLSGAEEGIFDIDKLGDAINEFSIRVLDGSDTTKHAFQTLGMDADEMANRFSQGGETAKAAFKETVNALEGIEDPLQRNTIGVELFGTMWEDTGGEALLALGDIQDGVDDTKGAIKKLDEVNANNLSNKFSALGRSIEQEIVYPILEDAYPAIEKVVDFTIENLDEIIPLAKTAGAAVAAIFVVNKASQFITSVKNITGTIKTFTTATKGASAASTVFDSGVGKSVGTLGSFGKYAGIAGAAATVLGGLWTDAVNDWDEAAERMSLGTETLNGMTAGANNWATAMQSATGYLDSFNSTLFATTEEQQALSNNMQEVQDGITTICRTATEERRGYTDGEITQLDEYFTKLNELQDQQYQIEEQKMEAISQAAMGYAQNQNVSYEKYQETAANWLETAQQQKDAMLQMIDDQTIQEIALLNQRYGDQATMANEAYANEYNALITSGDSKKEAVEQNMTDLYGAYANGYSQINNEDSIFTQRKGELQRTLMLQTEDFVNDMDYLNQNYVKGTQEYENELETITTQHNVIMGDIWKDLLSNMDSSQAGQLTSWLQMVTDAQMHGAELDQSTSTMVNTLITTFGELPEKTKDTVKDTLTPMLDGLKEAEPQLYSASRDDANSVIKALEDALEINSPSRVVRRIFGYAGEGGVLGLKDKESDINRAAYDMADSAIGTMEDYDLYNSAKSIGSKMGQGMESGISGAVQGVVDMAASMVNSALNAAWGAAGRAGGGRSSRSTETRARTIMEDTLPEERSMIAPAAMTAGEKTGKQIGQELYKSAGKQRDWEIPEILKNMEALFEFPDLSEYKKETVIHNVTQVYLGNRELTNVMTDGVIKKISHDQKGILAAKGGKTSWNTV